MHGWFKKMVIGKVTTEMSPISTYQNLSKVYDDAAALILKNLLNNKKLAFKEIEALIKIYEDDKSVFEKQEIELIVEEHSKIASFVDSEILMKFFVIASEKKKWSPTQLRKETKIFRSSIYRWIDEFTKLGLIIKSPEKTIGNVEYYQFNFDKYGRVILCLNYFLKDILAKR